MIPHSKVLPEFFVFLAFCLSLPLTVSSADTPPTHAARPVPWHTLIAGNQSESEKIATRDLCRYLAQVITTAPQVLTPEQWLHEPRPAVILGQQGSNPLLNNLQIDFSTAKPEGFILQNTTLNDQPLIIATGTTPTGATNAIYGLLRNLGYGFYLGSEAIPPALPDKLTSSPITQNSTSDIRGALPWHNFLNSPTVWDPVDHSGYIDQLARMGANFIGFHSYGDEPFTAFDHEGEMIHGKRLADTSKSVWSSHPLPTSQFAAGTSNLYAYETFGAATTSEPDADTAIRREQDVLRDALAYARARGLHACMGVEATGNPTHPPDRDLFLRQFNQVLDQYPSIDYIWIWQQEMRGAHGTALPQNTSLGARPGQTTDPLSLYADARRQIFDRVVNQATANPRYFSDNAIGKAQRAAEGARLEQYAQLALRTLNQRTSAPKLIISGWGGEDRMLSAEYYDGLDKLLPREVVFASLEYMIPRQRIDSIYSSLPHERQRWPIPWIEFDGDQWHPQPAISTFQGMLRNIMNSGSQGFLGIHWRTREIEQNFAYMIQAAWNPDLTAEAFFHDYALRCYGHEIAPEMAAIEIKLDELGYRWVGGRGQSEYNIFKWGPGDDPRKIVELNQIKQQIKTLLQKQHQPQTTARLKWMLHRIEYVLAYQETGEAVVKATALLQKAAAETDQTTITQLSRQAQKILLAHPLDPALHHYAQRITTRGEHGVLATINTKAWPAWLDVYKRSCEFAGDKFTTPTETWNPEPQILLPRHYGSVQEGKMLELMPIVLGGKPAYIHYRQLGQDAYQTDQLHVLQRWVFYTTVPAAMVRAPGVEFGFSFDADPTAPMAYGPIAVTAMPAVEPQPPPHLKAISGGAPIRGELKSLNKGRQIIWNDLPEAEYFSIEVNGRHFTDTALPFLPLSAHSPDGAYIIKAFARGQLLSESQPVQFSH